MKEIILSKDVVSLDMAENRNTNAIEYCDEAARVAMALVREHQLSGKTDTSTIIGQVTAMQMGVAMKVQGHQLNKKLITNVKSHSRKVK